MGPRTICVRPFGRARAALSVRRRRKRRARSLSTPLSRAATCLARGSDSRDWPLATTATAVAQFPAAPGRPPP